MKQQILFTGVVIVDAGLLDAASFGDVADTGGEITLSEKKIQETRTEIKKAPRRAFSKELRKQMNEDLDNAQKAIAQGTSLFKAGNIIEARDKIGDSERILKKINDKLSTGEGMSLM